MRGFSRRRSSEGLAAVLEVAETIETGTEKERRLHDRVCAAASKEIEQLRRTLGRSPLEAGRQAYLQREKKRRPGERAFLLRSGAGVLAALLLLAAFLSLFLVMGPSVFWGSTEKCERGTAGAPVYSPDGKQIAYASATRKCDGTQIIVVHANGKGESVVTYGEWPSWSPGGGWILSRDRSGFFVDSLLTGAEHLVDEDDGDFGASWSPDGSRIAFTHGLFRDWFGSSGSTLYVTYTSGGNAKAVLGHSCDPGTPAWSPDSKRLAFTCKNGLYVLGLGSKRLRKVAPGNYQMVYYALVNHGAAPSWSPDGRTLAFANGYGIELISLNHPGPKWVLRSNRPIANTVSWSPDGRHLSYSLVGGGRAKTGIYVLDLSTKRSVEVATAWTG